MQLESNQEIGSYRVLRPLGAGGMGAVYEVEHRQLGTHYALKTYTVTDENADFFRKRFATEGKILSRLGHPGLVRVIDLDFDESSGTLYYVMDLVLYADGAAHTLADFEPGSVDESQLVAWFRELCDVLAYVHEQGVVHRDIKLNNILVRPDGHVVLSDFGVSKVCDAGLRSAVDVTRTIITGTTNSRGFVLGTMDYLSPEALRGAEATPATDVYALGVTFFKMLTNVWYDPCLAPSADKDGGIALNSVKLLESFQYRWVDVLPAMLSENPEDRPLNLRDLPNRLMPHATERSARSLGPKLLATAALVVAAVVCWFAIRPDRTVPPVKPVPVAQESATTAPAVVPQPEAEKGVRTDDLLEILPSVPD